MKQLIPVTGTNRKKEPESACDFVQGLSRDVLARTIWGEARGEGSAGMQAVACVVRNRLARAQQRGGYWWGSTIIEICQKPYQFSAWNKNDPNYPQLIAVDSRNPHFALALRIADMALAGDIPDPTGGATHYHAAGITPYWARSRKPCAVIGRHIFYNDIEG